MGIPDRPEAFGVSSTLFVLGIMMLYLLLLFGIAHFANREREAGRSIVSNPYVYALTLSVYCSAWTFYGSIGRAATTGLGFLPIYLGPTLAMLLGWVILRKMIRISKEFRLTSISDFISFRYGRSYAIGALVTILSLMVITPYVALQLIAISSSIPIISGEENLWDTKIVIALLLAVFAIIFGARHLDPMERHEGLVAAVAFESVIKLLAFLAAGIYITWDLFGGYSDIISQVLIKPEYSHLIDIDYVSWFSLTLVSFFSIFLLPRQFHVMVVENSDESHLKKAMWIFPLYLFLINLFVPAVAGAGMLLEIAGLRDMFIISIPHQTGQVPLALLVFIGGASAATAMVLVDSVAVGNMMLNELEMPHLMRIIGRGRDLPSLLLQMKKLNILIVVALGYIYSRAFGYQSLADIGIVSFLAASQMAPAAIGGLYWKKGSREGALAGLSVGFLLWIYTALLPTFAKAGWLSSELLDSGPFGISFLRPTALLGINLDVWSNSAFWTLLPNITLYILVSLMTVPTAEEAALAEGFVDIYREGRTVVPPERRRDIRIGTVDEVRATLSRYVGPDKAAEVIGAELTRLGASADKIDARQLLELWDRVERILTGSLGPSATKLIVEDQINVRPVLERTKATLPSFNLVPGRIYLAPEQSYAVFTDQITHGIEGLCITTSPPDDVRQLWGFKETPILRLSHLRGGAERYISPTNLPLLFVTIKAFVESSKNSVVLLDSIQYLVSENAGKVPDGDVLDFVNQLERLVRRSRTRLILGEKRDFVHGKIAPDLSETGNLIFNLGPLPSYLLKSFVSAIASASKDHEQTLQDAVSIIRSDEIFKRDQQVALDDAVSCDPDMATGHSIDFSVDPAFRMTRRHLFSFLRRLNRLILRREPTFDIFAAIGGLLQNFEFSRYELVLSPGTTYVIEEDKPLRSLKIFGELIRSGMEGMCISRYNPEILHDKYDIPEKSVIWLTQRGEEGGYRSVDPTNFPRLSSIISDFLRNARDPVVLMEGLGYLITQSNYETVLRFIQSQRDDIALEEAVLLVHIDPLSLDTKELHRLESEMEPLEDPEKPALKSDGRRLDA